MQNAIVAFIITRQNALLFCGSALSFGIAHKSQSVSGLAWQDSVWAAILRDSMRNEGGNCTLARPRLSGL